jgi:hypothetical protein
LLGGRGDIPSADMARLVLSSVIGTAKVAHTKVQMINRVRKTEVKAIVAKVIVLIFFTVLSEGWVL